MSGRNDPVVLEIISLHKTGDHKGIIEQLRQVIESDDKAQLSIIHLLSWPIPTEEDLRKLSAFIYSLRISHVYSIGCGTGLLEWLLSKYLLQHYLDSDDDLNKIELTGVEVDFRWWTSPYAPPMFLPLQFVGKDFAAENPFGEFNDMAIFCYFNSIPVFMEYLKAFQGSYVLIIGPLSNKRFCAPNPLELTENFQLPTNCWELVFFQPFGLIEVDHVAVYKRVEPTIITNGKRRKPSGSPSLSSI